MQYREDKKSGNKLSALGFGCMRLPGGMGRIDKKKTEELLMRAYKSGVNYYDTAYLYNGSEEAVGEIFEKNGIREKIYLATKLPQSLCKKPEDFDWFFDIQKQRLRTGYIDYYLLHNITDFGQWEKLCQLGIREWVEKKKSSGEIRQIGFSFHGPCVDFKKLINNYDWDFVQIQYNYINTHYQAGVDGLHYAAARDIPVFIMEPLLGGKLANLPKEAGDIMKKADPGSTAVEWALRWLWNQPEVTLLLSGMNEEFQLDENVRLAETALPGSMTPAQEHTIQDVRVVFNMNYKIPCTGCNYCMPCPQKINIPACFEAYNASYAVSRWTGLQQYMLSSGIMSDAPHFASDCLDCGKCEKHCPQQIEICRQLKKVRRRLQVPGVKTVMPLAQKIMRGQKQSS